MYQPEQCHHIEGMANLPAQGRPARCSDAVDHYFFGGKQRELLGRSPRPGVKTFDKGWLR